ncbi:MAG: ATP-binding protein [Acidimicrobiales bacterium]
MAGHLELDDAPESVSAARHWTEVRAEELGLAAQSPTLTLLVSEMVSNVVLHARTPCEVRMDRRGESVRIEVRDGSDRLPRVRVLGDPLAQSGRGMAMVEHLSAAHGAEPVSGGGKVVWAEVALGSPSAPAP